MADYKIENNNNNQKQEYRRQQRADARTSLARAFARAISRIDSSSAFVRYVTLPSRARNIVICCFGHDYRFLIADADELEVAIDAAHRKHLFDMIRSNNPQQEISIDRSIVFSMTIRYWQIRMRLDAVHDTVVALHRLSSPPPESVNNNNNQHTHARTAQTHVRQTTDLDRRAVAVHVPEVHLSVIAASRHVPAFGRSFVRPSGRFKHGIVDKTTASKRQILTPR